MEALHIIQNEPERFEQLWDVTNYALKRFREEGFEIGETESPIIPLYVRDAEKTFVVTKMAYDAGVFINPVIPPACAPQDTLVRFALMATHTKEQVERGVKILKEVSLDTHLNQLTGNSLGTTLRQLQVDLLITSSLVSITTNEQVRVVGNSILSQSMYVYEVVL